MSNYFSSGEGGSAMPGYSKSKPKPEKVEETSKEESSEKSSEKK